MIDLNNVVCCGCTACYSSCPQKAIQMQPDREGFLYPSIDKSLCVQCGICEKICPVLNKPSVPETVPVSYVVRTKNEGELLESTSGGFVSPLFRYVTGKGGYVCAATYDEDFKVRHMIFKDDLELQQIRGSKYVQSSLDDVFRQIKGLLDKGSMVCFIGTTCQVSGLKSFLRKDYDRLILVDLVCHGTPSPKLWDKYLEFQKEKNGEIRTINFRNKTYGYHGGTMKIVFENGKAYYGSARVDYMLKSFFGEIASRKSCYSCSFKTLNRCSDFTIYDSWHAGELVAELKDDDKGFTNLIIQSERGRQIFEEIKNGYEYYITDTERAVSLDGVMVRNSAVPHTDRNAFYQDIDSYPIDKLVNKYLPIGFRDRVIERLKIVIYRLGLFRLVKKLKG